MFKVGKKYVFSKRKYVKVFGKADGRETWVSRLVGVVFIATSESAYANIIPYDWHSDDEGLSVCFNWCTEIK
jgi:hypothetical protein